MKNKKLGAKILAALLCASLAFPVSVYAAEENETGTTEAITAETKDEVLAENPLEEETEKQLKEQTETETTKPKTTNTQKAEETKEAPEEKAEAEEDIMPTIGKATVTLGKSFVYTPITAGSGKYKASKIKLEMVDSNTGLDISQQNEPVSITEKILSDGLDLFVMFTEAKNEEEYYKGNSGKAGDYAVRVIFLDENENEICSDEKSIKVHVDEDWSVAKQFPNDELKWDGVSDLVFTFFPGYGMGAADEWIWGVDTLEIGSHGSDNKHYTIYNGKDYVLDLNGHVTIKSSFLKRIANENKNFGDAEYYYLDTLCELKSGSQPVFFAFTFTYDKNASHAGTASTPVKEVTLPAENTTVSADKMASLVEQNKEADVVIHNPNGVDFTFAKGSMKLIAGKESYDFGTTLITDVNNSGITGISAEEFAFRINYNYSGELPGKAKISISLGKDSKWIGKTLYYSLTEAGKIKKQIYKNVVDKNGVYTIEQNHCSDYVATTKSAQQINTSAKTTVGQISTSPKTGDTSYLFLFMALALISGVTIFKVWGAKRRVK